MIGFSITESDKLATIIRNAGYLLCVQRAFRKDLPQQRRYGADAPRYCEKIIVPTKTCNTAIATPVSRRKSGHVTAGDWDQNPVPLSNLPKFAYCMRHWQDGLSWEESGAYDHMENLLESRKSIDGCRSRSDIIKRFEMLDAIFEAVRKDGGLTAAGNLPKAVFKEYGGILVHIDRNGMPLFGLGGFHRLAIAKILKFPNFPAQIGLVHPDAIGALGKYRRPDG